MGFSIAQKIPLPAFNHELTIKLSEQVQHKIRDASVLVFATVCPPRRKGFHRECTFTKGRWEIP